MLVREIAFYRHKYFVDMFVEWNTYGFYRYINLTKGTINCNALENECILDV